MNFDCSTLWVRDRIHLTDALDITPAFLRTKHGDAGESWTLQCARSLSDAVSKELSLIIETGILVSDVDFAH